MEGCAGRAREAKTTERELRIAVAGAGEVSALLLRPAHARWVMALAHGAGAGMRHPFMGALAMELAAVGVATLRYQFPYMEEKKGKPDSPEVAAATVAAAVQAARVAFSGLPVLAGGGGDGGGSRASGERGVFRFGGAGGREVLWREDDFDGRGRGKTAASGGTHLFRISAASAEAARNETRGTSVEGEATDAVLARDARRPGRPGIAAADLQGVGRASDTTRDGWSGSFVSRTEEIGEDGCGSVAGARGDNRGVGEKLPRIALPSRFPFLSGHFESSGLNAMKAFRRSISLTPMSDLTAGIW